MNFIDICIVIIVLFFLYRGYRRGFIHELFGIIIFIGGLIVAILFFKSLAVKIDIHIKNRDLSLILAFILIFTVSTMALIIIRNILSDLIENLNLTDIDSILGMVVSLLKISLVISFILNVLLKYHFLGIDRAIQRSFLFPIFNLFFRAFVVLLPQNVFYII